MKRKFIAAALAGSMLLSGCSLSHSSGSSESSSAAKTQTASYSLSELKDMLNEPGMVSEFINERGEADYSGEAVKAYNAMLTYAEKELGGRSYKLYDLYYVDSTEDYVAKIVLDEYKDSGDTENVPIMISCDKKGEKISSGIPGFLYARDWTNSVSSELSAICPDYHMNTFYLLSDHLITPAGDKKDLQKDYSGEWSINLVLPVGTKKSDFEKNYPAIKTVLDKYSVTELNLIVPDSKEAYDKLLSKETISGNCYYFNSDGVDWLERDYKGN